MEQAPQIAAISKDFKTEMAQLARNPNLTEEEKEKEKQRIMLKNIQKLADILKGPLHDALVQRLEDEKLGPDWDNPDRLNKLLTFTPDQMTKVKEAWDTREKAVKDLGQPKPLDKDYIAKKNALVAKYRDGMKGVLTEDQMKKFVKARQEHEGGMLKKPGSSTGTSAPLGGGTPSNR
jgi:hypothetical protein